jgi:hypothetical protein
LVVEGKNRDYSSTYHIFKVCFVDEDELELQNELSRLTMANRSSNTSLKCNSMVEHLPNMNERLWVLQLSRKKEKSGGLGKLF